MVVAARPTGWLFTFIHLLPSSASRASCSPVRLLLALVPGSLTPRGAWCASRQISMQYPHDVALVLPASTSAGQVDVDSSYTDEVVRSDVGSPATAPGATLLLDPFVKYAPNQPRDDQGQFASVHRGLSFKVPVGASDADIIAKIRILADNGGLAKFGHSWSTEADVAREFALRGVTNMVPPGHAFSKRERTGVVLEAKVKESVKRDSFMSGFGEGEIENPGLVDEIESITAHVHRLPADQSVNSNTYERSFEIPREVWDDHVRKFNENHDERGRFAVSRGVHLLTPQNPTVSDVMSVMHESPGKWWTPSESMAQRYAILSEKSGEQAFILHGRTRNAQNPERAEVLDEHVDVTRIDRWDGKQWVPLLEDRVRKFNPNHDERGRFSSGSGVSLKGDYNSRGGQRISTKRGAGLEGYLNVGNVDVDTITAIRDTYEGEWGGLRAQVTDINATEDGGNIHVNGHVLDEDDEQVGDFTRDIFPETGEVSHQDLFLSDAVQGRGFAKGFITQSEAHYRAQGMKSILIHAVDIGAYAWARAGFDFTEIDDNGNVVVGNPPSEIRGALEQAISEHASGRRLMSPSTYSQAVDMNLRLARGQHVSAHEIAMLGHDDKRWKSESAPDRDVGLGAWILLGQEWSGIKPLDVKKAVELDDLTDEDWEWIERACTREGVAKGDSPGHPFRGNQWTKYATDRQGPSAVTRSEAHARGYTAGPFFHATNYGEAVRNEGFRSPGAEHYLMGTGDIEEYQQFGSAHPVFFGHTREEVAGYGDSIVEVWAKPDRVQSADGKTFAGGLYVSDPTDVVPVRDEVIAKFDPFSKYAPSQPRDDHGRWTDGGNTSGVVHTDDTDVALGALEAGYRVELGQRAEVTVLLDKMRDLVSDAKARGDKAPNYDLCRVQVRGSNIFCGSSKNIPRAQMPQLKGVPTPGSKADALPRDQFGEVSLTEQFKAHLASKGINIVNGSVPADMMKATQNELSGPKVAALAHAYTEGKLLKERLFISRDWYIVDGHHRWAAVLGTDLADNIEGDLYMDVAEIDMPILDVVAEANAFASDWGIPQATLASGFASTMLKMITLRATNLLDPFRKFNHAHDERGRFAETDGGSIDRETAIARLQSVFPGAVIDLADDIFADDDGETYAGMVEGFEKVAKEFPEAAKEVALVRLGDNLTEGMAETIITTVRKPDGSQRTGFGFTFERDKNDAAYYEYMADAVDKEAAWGEFHDGSWSRRSNVQSLDSHKLAVESNAIHEFGHLVHMTSSAKGINQSPYDRAGKNETMWADVMGHDLTTGMDLPRSATRDPDNLRLENYMNNAADNPDGPPPPSYYAGGNTAELFAESFGFRHGPKGSGLMGATHLDPELEAIIAKIEADSHG